METRTYKVYKFNELSDEAKEKAIEKIRKREYNAGFPWSEEYRQSLEGFAKFFDITLKDWSVGGRGEGVSFDLSENMDGLKGVRLYKYLVNNYLNRTKEYKYSKEKKGQKYNVLAGECFFTGFCADENLLDAIREFCKKPKKDLEARELFEACFWDWIKAYNADSDYQTSDEGIKETIEANDYDFLENGTID